jgi:phage terminase Nu1 subunit (DNA packaging protein)
VARIIGQERIADIFGVAPKTVVEWQEQGFPVAQRGGPGVASEYETQDCISWFTARELDRAGRETARDRLARLQADKVERELRQMDRELLEAKDVEPAIRQWLTDHCAELDQVPDAWIDQFSAAADDPAAMHQLLRDIMRQLKESAAAYEFSSTPDQEAAGHGI